MTTMEDMMARFGRASMQVIIDECLNLGLRDVKIAPITISGGGLPPETFDDSRSITDEEVREWEQRTGRTFVPV